jgi:hypothetical protein
VEVSEMVRIVADAIDRAVTNWQPGSGLQIKDVAAISAIDAMRKPTEAMVKAGAAAMCCQAQTLGCAAQHAGSDFKTCMLSTFIVDARRCLDAALSPSPNTEVQK